MTENFKAIKVCYGKIEEEPRLKITFKITTEDGAVSYIVLDEARLSDSCKILRNPNHKIVIEREII